MAIGEEKLAGLDQPFADKVRKIVADMERRGWKIRIIWGARTKNENDILVGQKLASQNSKHLTGKAVDLIDRKVGYSPDKTHKYYKDLRELTKKYSLKWGGDFSSRWDPCHIEMP